MAARYGQLILSDGIATIPITLYYKQAELQLLAQEIWFVSAILARKWDAELPYPNLHEMATRSGLTARQLERYRASLEQRHYLVVHPRLDPITGRRLPNAYDFSGLFARLEALLAADPAPHNDIRAEEAPPPPANGTTRDYSFVARYGRVIAQAGIAAIPQALFTHQRALQLSVVQVWFICYILAHKWTTDLPYPSLKLMAARTGYSQQHLHNIKDSLVQLGYLRVIGRIGQQGGQDTNAYDFSGLFTALIAHIQGGAPAMLPAAPVAVPSQAAAPVAPPEETPPLALPASPRIRRGQRRAMAQPSGATPVYTVPAARQELRPTLERGTLTFPLDGVQRSRVAGSTTYSLETPPTLRLEGSLTSVRHGTPTHHLEGTATTSLEALPTTHLEATLTPGLDETEPVQEESIQEESDSNRQAPLPMRPRGSRGKPPCSPYIAGVILDYSRELGDPLHGPANVTQAGALWQSSGLPEEAFVAQLYVARQRVRLYQGKQGLGHIENKMAYFFWVLRDLIHPPPC
ncbi:MAG: hypothetical protein M3Z04_11970 [Chloroflexota bacterium]|nr:hypothetical protein [Chloroflexota bacterium]